MVFLLILFAMLGRGEQQDNHPQKIITGADRTTAYMPLLANRKVAVFANQTSMVGGTHLIDTLRSMDINVVKIFGPEHGFRGDAGAGDKVKSGKDSKTGLPIISLYGDHKKPTAADLSGVDVIVFDIQDVGVRFYTYISSLEYVMEAALENDVPIIILDRPNPNGFYVDGPVLKKSYKSFVGMQEVPVVYGMTIGEYALMLAGEQWLSPKANARYSDYKNRKPEAEASFYLEVIKCQQYNHNSKYVLPVATSPNLADIQSVYWYPSTCFFEGTVISEGRGTDKPFQYFGHPQLPKTLFSFTPMPNAGAKASKCYFQKCYGYNVSGTTTEVLKKTNGKLQLEYLLKVYDQFPGKDSFFLKNLFFDKLAGSDVLRKQIIKGVPEKLIRQSWEPDLKKFKAIRKKYLLYSDFDNA